jgi:hypothetical protein
MSGLIRLLRLLRDDLRALLRSIRALFGRPAGPPTVDIVVQPFGSPSDAEFYANQTNPQSSDGVFVFKRGSAEEVYLVPSPLLQAPDLANVTVAESAPGSPTRRVEVTLTPAGRAKVQALAATTTPDNPIALVWQSEVFSTSSALSFDQSGPIVVAASLTPGLASQLSDALT